MHLSLAAHAVSPLPQALGATTLASTASDAKLETTVIVYDTDQDTADAFTSNSVILDAVQSTFSPSLITETVAPTLAVPPAPPPKPPAPPPPSDDDDGDNTVAIAVSVPLSIVAVILIAAAVYYFYFYDTNTKVVRVGIRRDGKETKKPSVPELEN